MQPAAVKGSPPELRPRADSGTRDVFVLVAMCVVVVAIGMGLFIHFETGFLVALAAAVAAYVGLIIVHVLVRRTQTVIELNAEITRLNQQLAEFRRTGPRGA